MWAISPIIVHSGNEGLSQLKTGGTRMKYATITVLALAVLLYAGAAIAQHGHGPGGNMGPGGSMGPGNSMGHGMNTSSHGSGGGSSSTSKRPTINDLLTKNPTIAGKIATLTGMSAQDACNGFKNLGQCVAAAHVANNHLGIKFDCLKADMTGIAPTDPKECPAGTGSSKMSLGKAIQTLSPNSDHTAEAKKGQKQADQDIKDSNKSS
jgi:hypothetical protein